MSMKYHSPQINSISAYYIWYIFAFALVLIWVLAKVSNGISISPLPTIQYNTYECATGNENNINSLKVYAYSEEQAVQVSTAICGALTISQPYQNVHASWQRRDQSLSRVIFDKQYQLIIMKPELMEQYDITPNDRYLAIASYGDYSPNFISLESQPQLTNQYFEGKRLGLLDNPDSISGYKLPKLDLRNAGIDESILSIKFYESHLDLYRALVNGEVEIIASGIQLPVDADSARHHFTLPINSVLRGARWYLHPELVDTNLHCQLDSMFLNMASNPAVSYDSSLKVIRPCSE